METVSLLKRTIIYVLNTIFFSASGLGIATPFLLILDVGVFWYIIIGVAIAISLSIAMNFLALWLSKGYTMISVLFGVKVVCAEEKNINKKQAIIRMLCESLLIFAVLDLIYLIKNRTERGVIDRLSDTFMIDLRK